VAACAGGDAAAPGQALARVHRWARGQGVVCARQFGRCAGGEGWPWVHAGRYGIIGGKNERREAREEENTSVSYVPVMHLSVVGPLVNLSWVGSFYGDYVFSISSLLYSVDSCT
jgi:hypothetical protein